MTRRWLAGAALAAVIVLAYLGWRSAIGTYAVPADEYAVTGEASLEVRISLPEGVTPSRVVVREDDASVTIDVRAHGDGRSLNAFLVYVPVELERPLDGREVRDASGVVLPERAKDPDLPVLVP
ncbi:hypothetical protein [Demequina maris]|uniref:hypothetical protein n=1 Tax=Demequina maris TaxID=1638982 RepID=UPI00078221DE|nr:hypothetical protein [Demequina maris]